MIRFRLLWTLAVIVGLALTAACVPPVGADNTTPEPVTVGTTPLPTVLVLTPYPSSTPVPRVLPERTPEEEPTLTPVPVRPTVVRAVPTITAAPLPASTAAPYIPLPSAEQLQESARLRWGSKIPAAVRRWAFLIVPISRHYGIDPNLVAAVMTMESGGDPAAQSPSDARGLMQVLHGPWDPRANITQGVSMLATFLDEFHDLDLALAAYNAGPAAVTEYGGVPPYRETHDYVIIVHYLYDLYGHRSLSSHRKAQYQSTLSDLARFAPERKKIPFLSQVAHARLHRELTCSTFGNSCVSKSTATLFPTLDPFWPMPGLPDPLQHVGPALASP